MRRPRLRLLWPVLRIAACLALAVAAGLPNGRAAAQAPANQIELSEKQVQGFIAAQKPMSAITEKMQGAASNKPDPKIQARLEAVAKKNGFKDFAEFGDVSATISLIMAGIDPDTRKYTPADVAIRQQIADLEADTTMPAAEKAQMLKDLNESLKQPRPVPNPANIKLVEKYYAKIEAALE